MPKRTGDEDDTGIPASAPKLTRRSSTNTNSTEDNYDEDNDCIVVPSRSGMYLDCDFVIDGFWFEKSQPKQIIHVVQLSGGHQ